MAFKIYTRSGDGGQTALFGGKRLPKSHLRIDSYGTVDELNSFLGLVADTLPAGEEADRIKHIQDLLFTVGSNLASDPDKEMIVPDVHPKDIEDLEAAIDQMNESLPELKNFILPGGHPTVSYCHVARCVCRRAERLVVALSDVSKVEPIIIRYLNRLSDYLFVLARYAAHQLGVAEKVWAPRKSPSEGPSS
ncbi:MAG: cob(I)yrinic acid a,c-diamide adenosyltransferase [Bacteroidota bacterium]